MANGGRRAISSSDSTNQSMHQGTSMKIKLFKSQVVGLLCATALLAGVASGPATETNAGAPKSVSPDSNPKAGAQKVATAAAQTWLATVDDGHYAQSWDQASELFRKAITQDKWVSALENVRKPLGKLGSRTVISAQTTTNLPGSPDGQYVVMQFQTSFAGKKSAIETVTFMQEKDGQWRAAGYYIN
jgi:hypothetical protein